MQCKSARIDDGYLALCVGKPRRRAEAPQTLADHRGKRGFLPVARPWRVFHGGLDVVVVVAQEGWQAGPLALASPAPLGPRTAIVAKEEGFCC